MKYRIIEPPSSLLFRAVILLVFAFLTVSSTAGAGTGEAAKTVRIGGTGTALAAMRHLGE